MLLLRGLLPPRRPGRSKGRPQKTGAAAAVRAQAAVRTEEARPTPDGKVRLKLRKPYYTGQTEIVLEPREFLRRLIATIPPKRLNMVRFHGVFAPRA